MVGSELSSTDRRGIKGKTGVPPGIAVGSEDRRKRRQRELRARIYEIARELFLEHGYKATTVNQIADAADIAPATFFNYFQSKSAILEAMTLEVFVHLEELVDEEFSRPGSAAERIGAFATRVAGEILSVHGLAKDVLLELVQMGLHEGDVAPHLAGLIAPFTDVLREGQRQGSVRSDCDADFLAELVVGALNTTITHWMSDPGYPLADRLERTASIMGEAIAPRRTI
jgi:AcrR family transcriptional regulator